MIFKPHNYQKYCIDRVLELESLGLFLDMGLGKTAITLTAVDELKFNRFEIDKVLIIAPKKVAESTWGKEADKWDHLKYLKISKVLGGLKQRIIALNTPADVFVINRENVKWLVEYYQNDWPFDMVVVDEFSSFKDQGSKRFRALRLVRSKIKRFVGLTGTPAPNGLKDLWAQLYLLDRRERLGKTITTFRERYFNYVRKDGLFGEYYIKQGANEAIMSKISDICISMKSEDYLELPDIIYNTVPVELDAKARKSYNELERNMLLELNADDEIDVTSATALTWKLLQLSNGAVYDENRKVHEIHNCKIERFIELIEELNGKSVLVFYSFKHDLDRIKRVLGRRKELKVRELKTVQDEKDWNSGKVDILLTHPASAAYGLNLQDGGNHVIWFGLNWSLELYQQANKRLHRQGQKEKVIIHHLVCGDTRDEDVMKALQSKGDVQEELLQSLKARIEKYRNGG